MQEPPGDPAPRLDGTGQGRRSLGTRGSQQLLCLRPSRTSRGQEATFILSQLETERLRSP